jgi:DNA repair protein RAD5
VLGNDGLLNSPFSAIDRVHRIGQNQTVYVKHYIVGGIVVGHSNFINSQQVSGTIEGRILQIQKRKTALIKEAFKGKGDAESMQNLKIMFGEESDDESDDDS